MMPVKTRGGRGGRLSEVVIRRACGQLKESKVPNRVRFYDRDGNGIRLPEGWWLDLDREIPSLVSVAKKIDLPISIRSDQPNLSASFLLEILAQVPDAVRIE